MSDTTTTEKVSNKKVTVEDAGPCTKKITIEVPAEEVDEAIGGSLDTVSVEAELPGFRKGRAPKRLLEKKFGKTIRNEAKGQLVSSAYQEAVEEHGLKVLGDPDASALADIEVADGEALTFTVEVEVLPEFDLPELEGIKVKRPEAGATDEMLDEEMKRLCLNEGQLEPRDEPAAGDYITGHGVMTGEVDGEAGRETKTFYDIPGAVVRVPEEGSDGSGMILGVHVEDFAKQLGLPKPGEQATIRIKGPDSHENEEIRGVDLTVTFDAERVDRINPAEEKDLAERFGLASAEELRERVRERLDARAKTEQQVAMRQQVARHLLDNVSFELPKRLTAGQASRTLDRRRMELMYRGVDPHAIEENMARLRAASAEQAQRELKLFFILNKVAEKFDVNVEEGEINQRIAQMAMERGERPERLRQELIQSGRVNQVFQQIREHKAMDAVVAKAEVEDVSREDYKKFAESGD